MGRQSKFPLEFRREAVRLVLTTDKPMVQVARDLGISEKTLGNWVRSERANVARDSAPGAVDEAERDELAPAAFGEQGARGSSVRSCARQPPISPRRRPGEPLPVRSRPPTPTA